MGIIELEKIEEGEMKERLIKEYKRRLRLILRSILHGRNKVTAMSTWAVTIFRYGAGILSCREHELNSIDRNTWKMISLHSAFHLKSGVDRLYLTRREGGRGLISIQHCVRDEENSLRLYVKNSAKNLIQGVCMAVTIETEGIISKSNFKQQKLNERKQKWLRKRFMDGL